MASRSWARIWYATGLLLFVIGLLFEAYTSSLLHVVCDGGALLAMCIAYYYIRKDGKGW